MRLHMGVYRESALKMEDSGRKNPLPHREIESASAACRSDALPTELHPHPINHNYDQLSWILWRPTVCRPTEVSDRDIRSAAGED